VYFPPGFWCNNTSLLMDGVSEENLTHFSSTYVLLSIIFFIINPNVFHSVFMKILGCLS